jgi:hypothetical protein
MNAPTNPKATPRSSERFKEVVSQPLPNVHFPFFAEEVVAQPRPALLFAFFLDDEIVVQPLLAVLFAFFWEAVSRKPGTGVLQLPSCRE